MRGVGYARGRICEGRICEGLLYINSFLPQFIINSATHAGSAAAAEELEKDDKYHEDVSYKAPLFIP